MKTLTNIMNVSPQGYQGSHGPNSYGYMHDEICNAAKSLKCAQSLYRYGYGTTLEITHPENYEIKLAMDILEKLDIEYCRYNNKNPNTELFSTHIPQSLENNSGKYFKRNLVDNMQPPPKRD